MLLLCQCCEKPEGSLAPQHIICLLPCCADCSPAWQPWGCWGAHTCCSHPSPCPLMLWPVTLKLLLELGAGDVTGRKVPQAVGQCSAWHRSSCGPTKVIPDLCSQFSAPHTFIPSWTTSQSPVWENGAVTQLCIHPEP